MLKIRLLSIEDYAELYSLWKSVPGIGLNSFDDTLEGISKFLLRNPSTCFAAECDNKIVGAIMAGHDGRRGYIYHTAVLPEYQRQGIGHRLVEAAMKALDEEGICKAALVVFKRNNQGNEFWERMGFTSRDDLMYRNRNIHDFERFDT